MIAKKLHRCIRVQVYERAAQLFFPDKRVRCQHFYMSVLNVFDPSDEVAYRNREVSRNGTTRIYVLSNKLAIAISLDSV